MSQSKAWKPNHLNVSIILQVRSGQTRLETALPALIPGLPRKQESRDPELALLKTTLHSAPPTTPLTASFPRALSPLTSPILTPPAPNFSLIARLSGLKPSPQTHIPSINLSPPLRRPLPATPSLIPAPTASAPILVPLPIPRGAGTGRRPGNAGRRPGGTPGACSGRGSVAARSRALPPTAGGPRCPSPLTGRRSAPRLRGLAREPARTGGRAKERRVRGAGQASGAGAAERWAWRTRRGLDAVTRRGRRGRGGRGGASLDGRSGRGGTAVGGAGPHWAVVVDENPDWNRSEETKGSPDWTVAWNGAQAGRKGGAYLTYCSTLRDPEGSGRGGAEKGEDWLGCHSERRRHAAGLSNPERSGRGKGIRPFTFPSSIS